MTAKSVIIQFGEGRPDRTEPDPDGARARGRSSRSGDVLPHGPVLRHAAPALAGRDFPADLPAHVPEHVHPGGSRGSLAAGAGADRDLLRDRWRGDHRSGWRGAAVRDPIGLPLPEMLNFLAP